MNATLRLLRPFFRGFPIIVLVMIISFLVAKKYLSYTTAMYESTVKIKLADLSEGVPNNNLFKDLDVFSSTHKIAGEIELMKSSLLVNKVANGVGFNQRLSRIGDFKTQELYEDSPILVDVLWNYENQSSKTIIKIDSQQSYSVYGSTGQIGDTIVCEYGKICVRLNTEFLSSRENTDIMGSYELELLSEPQLLEEIKKNLDIHSIEDDVPVIAITYKSAVPKKAAVFVNALAERYIQDYIETKFKAANITVEFLSDRISDVAKDLTASEKAIEQFKNNKGIINLRQETETDLRKIAQLKIQQTNLKMSLDAIKDLETYLVSNKDRFLEMAPNFEAFNDLLSTEISKKIKLLQAEKHDLLLTYTEDNEQVVVVDTKLKDLTSYLLESVSNTKRNLNRKLENLNQDIALAETSFIGLPSKEKNLNILNRDFTIYQNSYNFLNEKRIEAEIAQAAKVAFHRIITPALPSNKPVSPNRPIIIIVSIILGFIGSTGLIYAVHELKSKVNDLVTIETNSSIPVALKTPFIKTHDDELKYFLKQSNLLDLKGLVSEKSKIVLTSYNNKEGRSFHARLLANAFEKQGYNTLLITIGVDLVFPDISNHIHIDSSELLNISKNTLKNRIDEYSVSYDLTIIDNVSMKNEHLGLLAMHIADTNLYVLDARQTPEKHIEEVELLKQEFNISNLHFILNKFQYNPNVILEVVKLIKKSVSRLKSLKNA